MNSITDNYSAITALIASITGLLALGITLYSKKRDTEVRLKELALQQSQFDLEKKHQISKEKYQQLFEEKIDVYRQLFEELKKLQHRLHKVGQYEEHPDQYEGFEMREVTLESVNIDTLQKFFKLIDDNYFLISSDLIRQYKIIYNLYKQETAEFNHLYDAGAIDGEDVHTIWSEVTQKIYAKHLKQIDEFFTSIEQEIQQIKKILEAY